MNTNIMDLHTAFAPWKQICSIILFLLIMSMTAFAQQTHTVDIPRGVVYKYCDEATLSNAKALVTKELTETPSYQLNGRILFVGPVLWTRFKKSKTLSKIEGGNVTLRVDNKELSAKMTQEAEDSKSVWDELRKEIDGKKFKLREANAKELAYYWSVISFDIEEPLIIVETKEHNYLLNLAPSDLQLVWIDEMPR